MPNTAKTFKFEVSSILGGISELWSKNGEGQFLASLGIDPEYSQSSPGSLVKPGGDISPTRYAKFSSTGLSGAPMWITSMATSAGVFTYASDGEVLSYADTLTSASEVVYGTPTNGAGQGMAAYNDYLYLSTTTNIARLGRMSQTAPAFTNGYWVTTLGMSALTNTTYPGIRDVTYPNHVLWPHNDGRLYIADYDGANGRIHSLTTDADGTNGSGSFNDLTLPPGLMPMDIKSYGTDLAILCSSAGTFSGPIRSGTSVLALWSTIPGTRPYRYIPINEPLATSLVNKNGELYVLAGNIDTNCLLLKYLGGYSFQTLRTIPEGSPPPAGAADTYGNMIAWGACTDYPDSNVAGVYAYGYRNSALPSTALNHIARATATGTLPIVSALKFVQRSKYPIVAWRDQTPAYGIDKHGGSGSYNSVFHSEVFNVGRNFRLRRIVIPLSTNVQANVTITPTVYIDNAGSNTALDTINSTNYASSEYIIDMQNLDIVGKHNFFLRLAITGTQECYPVGTLTFEGDYID